MAQKTLNVKMQVRRDTAANWKSKNPILAAGELGYDTTNKITKIGDGETKWNDLFAFVTTKLTFAEADWSTINNIAQQGQALNYFKVGDEKTIELTTGEQVTLVILGFNHDDLTSGGKASISIGMKNCLSTEYIMSNYGNSGGWNSSKMRTETMTTLLSQLPADLQKVIKAVTKKSITGGGSSSAPNSTTTTSSDKLWLLALAEIFSKTSIEGSSISAIKNNAAGYEAEGLQYDYYYNLIGDGDVSTTPNAALVKYSLNGGGSPRYWWLRTPFASGDTNFCCITNNGGLNTNISYTHYGVSFGFCV